MTPTIVRMSWSVRLATLALVVCEPSVQLVHSVTQLELLPVLRVAAMLCTVQQAALLLLLLLLASTPLAVLEMARPARPSLVVRLALPVLLVSRPLVWLASTPLLGPLHAQTVVQMHCTELLAVVYQVQFSLATTALVALPQLGNPRRSVRLATCVWQV